MKVKKVTDKELFLDDDAKLWLKLDTGSKFYFIGKTNNKKIETNVIDNVFSENDLDSGKYFYYFENHDSQQKERLDSEEIPTILHAKGTSNQKSFFKPKNGKFLTYYPKKEKYQYKFSIIMAVYNVEEYIDEAIQSLLNQTEKSFQLILVNDGTPDNSGEIAKKYAESYSNITYLEKENGGVSSARNLGMSVAEGEYWNFMDPDDTLSSNTLELVYSMFKRNDKITDIMSIPLYFFGDQTGEHPLNGKFKKGNRIVNLLDPNENDLVLSLATTFIKKEAIENERLDTKLKVGEDMLLINTLIIDKMTLGVVSGARYNYRRIKGFGALSNTQSKMSFEDSKERFLADYRIIKASLDKYGSVMKYIQYVVIYDLSWQFKMTQFLNDSILSLDEKKDLLNNYILSLFDKYIDLDNIQKSTRLPYWTKFSLIEHKADCQSSSVITNKFGIWRDNQRVVNILDNSATFVVANKTKNTISLYYQINFGSSFNKYYPGTKFTLSLGNRIFRPTSIEDNTDNMKESLYTKTVYSRLIKFDLNLDEDIFDQPIRVLMNWGKYQTEMATRYTKHEFSSLCKEIPIDSISDKLVTKLVNGKLQLSKKTGTTRKKLLKLAFGNDQDGQINYLIDKASKTRPIWLFEDRPNQAGDNAEALFKFVVENHPEIDAFFILEKDSPDYGRILSIGKVLPKFSEEHQRVWAIADVVVSAHGEYQIMNPISRGKGQDWHNYFKSRRILNKPMFVFLQHGISRSSHSMNEWLNKINKNIRLFITTANYETKEFTQEKYHYDTNVVQELGMPRLDLLMNSSVKKEKLILFMPTWRKTLTNLTDEQFLKTTYFEQVNDFLNDDEVIELLRKFGYKMAFKLHPNLMQFKHLFKSNNVVLLTDETYSSLYQRASIAITDFSSAVIDFAYMKKPVIQYQFDDETYFYGHTFKKDENNTELAIYGPMFLNSEYSSFINELKNKIKHPVMDAEFENKVDTDFKYRDGKNSERVFEAINNIAIDAK